MSRCTIRIENAAPINPKIAPDAPRLAVYGGKNNIEKKLPTNPDMMYIIINWYLE